MVEFNRKITPDTNVVISSIYSDMYMGSERTSNIGGAKVEQAYLARFTLPNQPIYGSAELARLDYSIYVNSINLAQNVFSFPEAVIYKTKDSKRLSLTEGTQRINDTKTKDVLIFSSHISGMSTIEENFNGSNQAYGDAVNFVPVQRAIVRESQLYVTPTNLYTYGKEIIRWIGGRSHNDYTISEFKTNFASPAEDLGIQGLPEGSLVIPCKPTKKMEGEFKYECVPLEGKDGYKTTYIRTDEADAIVMVGERDTIPNTDLYGDEMTPSNTVFEIVRGAAEFFGEQTKGEAAVELLATGAARLATTPHLTGGQAGELYTYWKDATTEVTYPALGKFTGEQGGANMTGAEDRQEVMICKKNIPFPIKHPAKPYRRGESIDSAQDSIDFANNLEIDMNIKSLAKAYSIGAYYTLRRALVICFSEDPPAANQSLFEFVNHHRDIHVDDAPVTLDGSTHYLSSIMNSDTTNDDGPKNFAAIAILNTDKGILICNAGFVYGEGALIGDAIKWWILDETGRDVLIQKAQFGADDIGESFLDQWVRLNFLFASQSYADYTTTPVTGPNWHEGGGTHSQLLISAVSDGQFIQNTARGGAGALDLWEVNSIINDYAVKSLSNWPRHLSIWLCNTKADKNLANDRDTIIEKNANMSSQVFIDKIAFKDFNYDIDNPNMNDRNFAADKITISPSPNTFIGPSGTKTTVATDKVSKYYTNSPTMMSFGVKNRSDLGWLDASRPDEDSLGWTSDEGAWLMFHGFKTTNLANLQEIPDENMIATYTHAGGDLDEDTGTANTITPHWGECYNTDYGFVGFVGALDVPALGHNNFEGGNSVSHTDIGLKTIHTGFVARQPAVTGAVVHVEPETNDTYLGDAKRTSHPFRIDDTLIWGPNTSGIDTRTITNVIQASDDADHFTLTASTDFISSGPADNEALYIQPEGLVNNFSKKGFIMLSPNTAEAGNTSVKAWAKRECGPASARIIDIIEEGPNEAKVLVDTLSPLKLDEDEQYMVYRYGGSFGTADFTVTGSAATINSTCDNAKVGLYITSMNATTNEITIQWDGKAEDGNTQLLNYNLLPVLMISPYRYWIHLNIDCSSYASSAPTTTLPARSYDSFSMMDHNFAVWDGSSYYDSNFLTSVVDRDLTAIPVTDGDAFTVGDTFMIGDEALSILSISNNDLTCRRGACGTFTSLTSSIARLYNPNNVADGAEVHATGSKIKQVTVHAAWGEEMSGNYAKMTSGGALGSLENRRNLGSTYNEYLINHEPSGGVDGAYINAWLPTVLKEGSIYETGTDFGFGAYKEDKDGGGELVRQILRAGEYNLFKMYDISTSGDFVVGGQLDLLFRYKDDTVSHITNIDARSATNPPFALAVFEDELPIAPSLSVIPNQADPFTPEFTWEAADDDLWYGLLHIDAGQIDNQYTNKVAHIPLNEDTTVYGNAYLENEGGTKIAAIAGTFTNSYEGLAGFAKDFNGTSDYIKFADFTAPTEEMTVVVHIIPDLASGTSYILNKTVSGQIYSDWEIYMDSSRQIVAKLLPVGVSTAAGKLTLTSTPITVDGETPTCIILTLDKNLKSGNGKLFINGKIEDQSGLIKSTPTPNNWSNDTNLLDSSGPLFIGCDVLANNSTLLNFFDGKIEEIVIYNKCLYPIVPSDGKFIFTKPVTEISNQSALSYSARLFVKDYHNIRGSTAQEVASSSPVSYRKAAFRLVD